MFSTSKCGRVKALGGYTLIEFAIVLSVTGVLIAAFATAYNIYLKSQQQLTTENNATAVMSAVSNYLIQNGAYPCPARSNAKRTDADYGIATQCDPTKNVDNGVTPAYPLSLSYPCSATSPGAGSVGCTVGAHAAGTCENGLCWEISDRVPALTKPLVRRGMVPFRTLGLAEDYALDGYKSRFAYGVTEALAVPGTYSISNGGVDVVDQFGTSMIKPPTGSTGGSGHFVLFSSGLDRAGAYSREGVVMFPCPTVGLDAENCNTSLINSQAVYRLAPYSESHLGSGTVADWHFDDSVKYFSTVQTPLWKIADSTGYHIVDLVNAGTLGVVGIKQPNPATAVGAYSLTADVSGVVHTPTNIDTAQLCPPGSSSNCFPVAHNIACPPGQSATAIPGGVNNPLGLSCTVTPQVVCPKIGNVQTLMVGVTASNTLICASNSNCPVTNGTLCNPVPGTPYTLPAAATGTTQTVSAGFSYQENWKCVGGNWQRQSTSGICNCTPGSAVTNTTTCVNQYGTGAGTWTGNFTTTTTTTCSPYNVSSATVNNCICTPTTQNQSNACPVGYTGGPVTQTRNWTCAANVGTWGSWTTTGGTCTCNSSATQTQTIGCPTGYTGSGILQKSTFNCAASPPAWGPWVTQTNSCVCDSSTTDYQTIGCTAPLVGTKNQSRNYNCVTDSWGPWTTYQDNCGSPTFIWQAVSNQTGPFGAPLSITMGNTCATQGTTASCSAPAGGGQYWHYDTCQCE